ncbi:carbamoyltransferase C-terminal domain-containing protein [Spartinivicinus ruber]|uniref:carbamoyltransferase C-terminal domain-containing protein n=1 Tax=Spartinivicinus ruber TaxID=2683272 RepID=UPI0013D46ADE|nr:carbamoyltransferase C-terminal domain-containing protein [Spartinivicinus ruber]
MVILGLNLGHDASATIIKDGAISGHALRERNSRVRHHLGIDRLTIEATLKQAKITAGDVEAIAIASTQQIPCLVNDPDYLNFKERAFSNQPSSCRLIDNPYWSDATDKLIVERWNKNDDPPAQAVSFLEQLETNRRIPMATHINWEILSILSPLYGPPEWLNPYLLTDTKSQINYFLSENMPQAFSFPLDVELAGKRKPGWYVNHHMAHAASSFYSSPYQSSMIFTHDGGVGVDSGFVFKGEADKITGIAPHWLECGQFYDYCASRLGLGEIGGAGKLMGLAPYGKGALNSLIQSGTRLDWEQWAKVDLQHFSGPLYEKIFSFMIDAAQQQKLNTNNIGNPQFVLSGAAPEIASAVQHMIERSLTLSISQAAEAFCDNQLNEHAQHLCLSGGVALNCPANSNLFNSGNFSSIHIEPHCEDGGLSIGAAQYVQYNIYDAKRKVYPKLTSCYAMMGPCLENNHQDVFADFEGQITWDNYDNWTERAADELAQNNIIAICFSTYETGPRALGHRSILANPQFKNNWSRVNKIKTREEWRPFAPVVLQDDIDNWFSDGPGCSPFMLFTHKACSREVAEKIPAVIHVDGTSRVQTVVKEDGPIFEILNKIKEKGIPPVLLNTSFNGPGEPIVNDSRNAINMLLNTEINVLFLDGFMVKKLTN